jgi:hypothetical protein
VLPKGISRFIVEKRRPAAGFRVDVKYQRRRIVRQFSDSRYGGRAGALAAAIAALRAAHRALDKPATALNVHGKRPTPARVTGVFKHETGGWIVQVYSEHGRPVRRYVAEALGRDAAQSLRRRLLAQARAGMPLVNIR